MIVATRLTHSLTYALHDARHFVVTHDRHHTPHALTHNHHAPLPTHHHCYHPPARPPLPLPTTTTATTTINTATHHSLPPQLPIHAPVRLTNPAPFCARVHRFIQQQQVTEYLPKTNNYCVVQTLEIEPKRTVPFFKGPVSAHVVPSLSSPDSLLLHHHLDYTHSLSARFPPCTILVHGLLKPLACN
jgi:hypothetical protein